MNFDNDSAFVKTKIENNVATILFFHPAQNALPRFLLNGIIAALHVCNGNDAVRVIVLKSDGKKTFCAGANFDELLAVTTVEDGVHFFSGFAELLNAMRTTRQPIIVAAQGKAVGGGVGICAAADFCIATENAAIKLSELAIGIGPFVIAPVVQRKTGVAAFAQLAYSPTTWFDANFALQNGIFNTVVTDFAALELETKKFSEQLATYSASALQHIKRANWFNTDIWQTLLFENAHISAELILTETAKTALAAFKNK